MDKKELINEIAKYACNACEMGGDFDGDCHDLIGEYTTCGICQGTANKIYDDFICKYIEELNEKDRQVQHLLRVCKILEIALNNALGLDYTLSSESNSSISIAFFKVKVNLRCLRIFPLL